MDNQYSQDYEESEPNQESMPHLLADAEMGQMYGQDERQRYMQNYPGMEPMQHSIGAPTMFQPLMNQYPLVINLNSLSSMLNDNRSKLLSATKASNEGEIEEAIDLLQVVSKNLTFLANAADLQSNSRFVLRQERELISQKDLAYFTSILNKNSKCNRY